MKKFCHPLLLKNQERVWLEEKKALEEKKKLDQLRKEKEEERQLQELQRLQEEQTGKKRTEKLEWMYATPATGSSQNPNDLEDYLLGKKRVDKILTADENAKLGAAHKNFIAVQNANNQRDIAAKIREDPLFAIKQQEQAAYQALMTNPLRLRELQERNGIKPKKDKKERKREKEERKRLKNEKKHQKDRYSRSLSPRSRHSTTSSERYYRSKRSASPEPYYSRSPVPTRQPTDVRDRCHNHTETRRRYSRSRSPLRRDQIRERIHSIPTRSSRVDGRSLSPPRRRLENGKRSRSRSPPSSGERSSSPKRTRVHRSPAPPPRSSRPVERDSINGTHDRAARLAAMTSNASSMVAERQERLKELLEREKAELEVDEEARAKSKGMSGFLSHEQKKVFGGVGGLEDRIRRGRGGMVVDTD